MTDTLIFLDIETTGLDPEHDDILELAMVATDRYGIQKRATFHAVIQPQISSSIERMDEWCKRTHKASGLMEDVAKTPHDLYDVEEHAINFVKEYFPNGHVILAGNSIHFDRKFIDDRMCRFAGLLHHRMIDVSGMREAFKITKNIHMRNVTSSHRALPDVLDSIALYQALMSHVR